MVLRTKAERFNPKYSNQLPRQSFKTTGQGNAKSVQSYNMCFRQQLNELIYAIRNRHLKPVSRSIAIEEEIIDTIKTCIMNLKEDIGQYVIPSQPDSLVKAQYLTSEMELYHNQKPEAGRPEILLVSRIPNEVEGRIS